MTDKELANFRMVYKMLSWAVKWHSDELTVKDIVDGIPRYLGTVDGRTVFGMIHSKRYQCGKRIDLGLPISTQGDFMEEMEEIAQSLANHLVNWWPHLSAQQISKLVSDWHGYKWDGREIAGLQRSRRYQMAKSA